ncbi:hypothetical protein GCM10018790_11340 [Kitasatospora xanthocidica]|uniref:transferase n=1 Tax=Kitasatospora xanthocidica TaxID=83382 RepID=UPI00167345FC|nr:transferase [Kitasatospora xanthocidica]GHF35309.1 hypothetical protein GCM10018790_11340 [Kitasatospora xanthocidica]
MSSRLRSLARLVTVLAVTAAYVALHLAVSAAGDRTASPGTAALEAGAALWCGLFALLLLGPALWLRHLRRSGAAELVRVVSQYVPPRPPWQRARRVANGLGLLLFGCGAGAVHASGRHGHTMPPALRIPLLLGGVAAVIAALLILRRTRPYAVRPAARALLLSGCRPVLYLRSFGDDEGPVQLDDGADLTLHTREEQLASALGAIGPVIAVGRPGERLPQLGAARFYLPLDDWKPTVLRLMDLSQLIVLRLGQGDGLWWEVEQVRTTQPARKLVLLLPGGESALAARLNTYLPEPLPPGELGAGGEWVSTVIVFDDAWTPRVFPVGPRRSGWSGWFANAGPGAAVDPNTTEVARAVRTALTSSGLRRRTMTWRSRLAAHSALLAGLGLAVTVALASWLGLRALQLIELW